MLYIVQQVRQLNGTSATRSRGLIRLRALATVLTCVIFLPVAALLLGEEYDKAIAEARAAADAHEEDRSIAQVPLPQSPHVA